MKTSGVCQIYSVGKGAKRIRLKGIISTEHRDRQGEIIKQDGLDFKPFLTHGWFNDNHSGATDDVLGYPERVYPVTVKGPDGPIAATAVEGWLLPTKRALKLLDISKTLRSTKADRSLGFSVEGDVVARDPDDKSVISRAIINHVAVTHVPVNPNTTLEAISKSLTKAGMDTSNMAALMPESLEDGEPISNNPVLQAAALAKRAIKGQRNMKDDYLNMFKNMPDDERAAMIAALDEYNKGMNTDKAHNEAHKGDEAQLHDSLLDSGDSQLDKMSYMKGDIDLQKLQAASDLELGLVKKSEGEDNPELNEDEEERPAPEDLEEDADETGDEEADAADLLTKGLSVLERSSSTEFSDSDLSSYLEDSEAAASVDASGFLKSLVEGQAASLDQISKSLNDVNSQQRATNLTVIALGRLVQQLQSDFTQLNKSVSAPRAPKGAATAPAAQAMAKSFNQAAPANAPLNKSVVLAGLQDQLVKNLDNQNLSSQIADAVIRYETTGLISDEMLALSRK